MLKQAVIGAAFSLLATGVFASELKLSRDIELLMLNGIAADLLNQQYQLGKDSNQIVVRYDRVFDTGSRSQRFESKPFVITFANNGKDITINPPKIYSAQHAESSFTSPKVEWILTDTDGKALNYEASILEGRGGALPYWDLAGLVDVYNKEKGLMLSGETIDTHVSQDASVSDALKQLQHWYKQASTEERKAFRKWMVDQE
ncbi:TPA: DUF2057 family protein [Vibrio vulnificus]|uniref:YccT family protein n=1 Tax=Vibrio vulnificus TaxID=672 RepID=UPI000CD1EFA6|nr:DUF2057 domain-containing protein [Vibrio vulnificus]EHD1696438.1 DUF2057 domain-containing protein [Vibrio vulnificus]EIO4103235.1 DUF2057 domain-containing protein [Vibrio vulnificus]EIV1852853.1 DUF2057 domain-containing protein [Vibrio vulnificus]ELC9714972.1 DUF2057 domain-containing protein [Vibrio vulnificus]ELS0759657.1 DUF2057 domain-containing protein [Vibrio vulnificus]